MAKKELTKKELSKMIQALIDSGAVRPEQIDAVKNVKGSNEPQAVVVSFDEYEGNEMIVLKRGANGRPFSFGKSKASMILEAIKSIDAFVNVK